MSQDGTKIVCKWKSCNKQFSNTHGLLIHLTSHLDKYAIDEARKFSNSETTATKGEQLEKACISSNISSTPARTDEASRAKSSEEARYILPTSSSLKSKRRDSIACEKCRGTKYTFNNRIVMCDSCGTWYHQRCHEPPISSDYIKDTNLPWFCKFCKK